MFFSKEYQETKVDHEYQREGKLLQNSRGSVWVRILSIILKITDTTMRMVFQFEKIKTINVVKNYHDISSTAFMNNVQNSIKHPQRLIEQTVINLTFTGLQFS